MINGQEVASGNVIEKPQITAEDAKTVALPDGASSGLLRVDGGPEYPVPGRDYLAIADRKLREDEGSRRELILWLRSRAFWALVGIGTAPETAYAYGQKFVGRYGRELGAYILGSAPDFGAAMVDAPEAWLDEPVTEQQTIRELFLDSIPPSGVEPSGVNLISVAERDALLERIESATTVAATKAILRDLIGLLCPG